MVSRAGFQRSQDTRDVAGADGAEAKPAPAHIDFQQRFQPECAAGTAANQVDTRRQEGVGDLVGAEGGRRRIPREPGPGHETTSRRQPASSSSSFAMSTRAYTESPTRTEGPQAQLPRQYTGSRVIAPSSVVSPMATPSVALA